MKQVFITGAAKRVGKALALAFADNGYDVAIHYNSSHEEALKVVEDLRARGVTAHSYRADLSNTTETEQMFSEVLKDFPYLNTIINSASLFQKSSLSDSSSDDFLQNYMIHVVSPIRMMQLLTQSRSEGNIINILDCKITGHNFERAPYLLAKKSLAEVTKMAAREFAPNFRVNGVSPGYLLDPSDNSKSFTKDINLLEKKCSLNNIISSVMFLLKNEDITGQIINIDGGEGL